MIIELQSSAVLQVENLSGVENLNNSWTSVLFCRSDECNVIIWRKAIAFCDSASGGAVDSIIWEGIILLLGKDLDPA